MQKKVLVIVAGPPCTGKTTLAEKVAEEFGLLFLYKDGIKERLMDALGAETREKSHELGIATYQVLYHIIESIMQRGISLVTESNFSDEHDSGQFNTLIRKYGYTALQLQCRTEGNVLLERYLSRTETGDRHPGHFDKYNYPNLKEILMKGYYEPLKIDGQLIEIDTTDFEKIDYEDLYNTIRKYPE